MQAPSPSNDPTTEMEVRSDSEAREKVMTIAKKAQFAMFGTYDKQGNCHSRPMGAVEYDGDELWFFTRADARKVREIRADPRVTIDYSDGSAKNWVSMLGKAEIIEDRAKVDELWMEPLRTWFPDGKDDPMIRLIKVEVETAEYWDSPSNPVVYGFGYLKAVTTGEPPSPGDIAQVRM